MNLKNHVFHLFFFSFSILIACSFQVDTNSISVKQAGSQQDHADSIRKLNRLFTEIKQVKKLVQSNPNTYDDHIAFLLDMHIPSQQFRFFVVDLKADTIITRGLVAHGAGSETGKQDSLQFSNIPNSYMTSLGNYKIGYSYAGTFGKSYKLYGLDSTNSKAFDRLVVLHRYQCVPDSEQSFPICTSLGCAMVSPAFFEQLNALLMKQRKAVVLRIYY